MTVHKQVVHLNLTCILSFHVYEALLCSLLGSPLILASLAFEFAQLKLLGQHEAKVHDHIGPE